MSDVFAIQDEISQAIAEKLRVRLAGDRSLVKRHTQNLEAFNLYLKGRYYLNKPAAENIAKSKDYFEQAIALDPNYAKPWLGLAWFYFNLGSVGVIPAKEADVKCRQAVFKALELDDMLPEAHAMIAVLRAAEFEWAGAEQEFRRALELGAEVSDVWSQYSEWYLGPMQRLDEAFAASRRALELDPLSPVLHLQLGSRYFQMRQYDQAIEQHRNALELDPNQSVAHLVLSIDFIQIGKLDEAVHEIETAAQFLGIFPNFPAIRGLIYACAGRIGDARKILEELQKLALQKNVPAIFFAIIYLGLGEIDPCFDWLDKAVDERNALILQVPFGRLSDPLRSHPRYNALLRKMNLEP